MAFIEALSPLASFIRTSTRCPTGTRAGTDPKSEISTRFGQGWSGNGGRNRAYGTCITDNSSTPKPTAATPPATEYHTGVLVTAALRLTVPATRAASATVRSFIASEPG